MTLGFPRFGIPCLTAALVCLLPGGGARAQTPPSPPTFPSAVELITVDAVVLGPDGRPVTGLTRSDFVLTENGRRREIATFEAFVADGLAAGPTKPAVAAGREAGASAAGRAFAILVDDLQIAPTRLPGARRAAEAFVDRSTRPGDEVILGTTSGDAWWAARIPDGRADFRAVLARLRGRAVESNALDRMTEYEAFWINTYEASPGMAPLRPDRPDSAPATPETLHPDRSRASIKERVKQRWKDLDLCTGTSCDAMVRNRAADLAARRQGRVQATLQAVRRGLDALAPVHGRKSLLLLSEGFVDDPASAMRDVVAGSREANTAVYFIDVRGLTALPGGGSAADAEEKTDPGDLTALAFQDTMLESAGAQALAEETGGFSVRNTNDFAAGADRIAEESRVFYLLGFYPPDGASARDWRSLRVEVNRPGLKVRARRGYRRGAGPRGGQEPVARALDSAHEATGIPLRAMPYVFEPRPKDLTRVLVAAEFDASLLGAAKGRSGRLELSMLATHRDTGKEQRFAELLTLKVAEGEAPAWRALAHEFELPAGVAQARVVVRDPASGATGSVTQRFEVPPVGTLRLSTPILTDRVETPSGPQSRPRPALSAHRVFPPEGRLYCQFEVFGATPGGGAAPHVSASLVVSRRGGRTIVEAPPTPIAADADGRVVRMMGLSLDGLETGAYELRLEVRDEVSGARLERLEPFTLARATRWYDSQR